MYNPDQGDALLYYTTLENADPELAQTILDAKQEQATTTSAELYGFQPDQDLYRAYSCLRRPTTGAAILSARLWATPTSTCSTTI